MHIRRLRASLEQTGRDSLIQTVRGSGYRFRRCRSKTSMSGLRRSLSDILMRTFWWLLGIAILIFAPIAISFGLNWGLAALIACLLLILLWHFFFLAQLLGWLDETLDRPLPRGRGVYGKLSFPDCTVVFASDKGNKKRFPKH